MAVHTDEMTDAVFRVLVSRGPLTISQIAGEIGKSYKWTALNTIELLRRGRLKRIRIKRGRRDGWYYVYEVSQC